MYCLWDTNVSTLEFEASKRKIVREEGDLQI